VVLAGRLPCASPAFLTAKWTDKDGVERRTTEIVCESLQLGPGPAEKPTGPARPSKAEQRPAPPQEEHLTSLDEDDPEDTHHDLTSLFEEEDEVKPEDIPF
jgi:hypothetical protein